MAEPEVPVAGFLERRNEGKRKVKLSKRGEELAQQLRSPKRARRSPENGGSGKSSETGKFDASQTESASLNRGDRNFLKETAEGQSLDLGGNKNDGSERVFGGKGKPGDEYYEGYDGKSDSGPVGALELGAEAVLKRELTGKKKRKPGPLKRYIPGGVDSSSLEVTALKAQKPVAKVSNAASKGAENLSAGLSSPRKLQFDVLNGNVNAHERNAKGAPRRDDVLMAKGREMREGGASRRKADSLQTFSRGIRVPEHETLEKDEAEGAVRNDDVGFHTPAGSEASEQNGMRTVPLGKAEVPVLSATETDGEGAFQRFKKVAEEFLRRTEQPAFESVEGGRDRPVQGTDEVIAPVLGAQVSSLTLPIFPVPPDAVLTGWTEQHLALLQLKGRESVGSEGARAGLVSVGVGEKRPKLMSMKQAAILDKGKS